MIRFDRQISSWFWPLVTPFSDAGRNKESVTLSTLLDRGLLFLITGFRPLEKRQTGLPGDPGPLPVHNGGPWLSIPGSRERTDSVCRLPFQDGSRSEL